MIFEFNSDSLIDELMSEFKGKLPPQIKIKKHKDNFIHIDDRRRGIQYYLRCSYDDIEEEFSTEIFSDNADGEDDDCIVTFDTAKDLIRYITMMIEGDYGYNDITNAE